jgi:hypothetical protein
MCPIWGELEAGSGQALEPVALGGDCKGNAAFALEVNAGGISLKATGFEGGSARVRGLPSFGCSPAADATEHR